MTRGSRWLVGILVGGTLAFTLTVGVTVASIYNAGMIAFDVDSPGDDRVQVAVPAGLANVAIALTPRALVRDVVDELDPGLLSAVRAGVEELERTEDFVLVDVTSSDESVRIEKRGKRLLINVDGDDGRFRVAIPLGTVRSALRKMDSRI